MSWRKNFQDHNIGPQWKNPRQRLHDGRLAGSLQARDAHAHDLRSGETKIATK
jgi:hypothetical protein